MEKAISDNLIDPMTVAPPRPVALGARVAVLFGGSLSQIGWLLLGFGMLFFWIFVWNSELFSGIAFIGGTQVAEGQIQRVETTGASENDTQVLALTYTFRADDGRAYRAVGYITGGDWHSGAGVRVEYLSRDPSVSRAQGLRRKLFGTGGAWAGVFPLIGLVMVLVSLKGGLRANWLLGNGCLAYGKLVGAVPTGTTINSRPLVAVTLEFHTSGGIVRRTVSKTTQPETLEDEPAEMLLYDRGNPSDAVTIDSLPGLPDVLPDNRIVLRAPEAVWRTIILPTLTVVGHGGYLLYQLLR